MAVVKRVSGLAAAVVTTVCLSACATGDEQQLSATERDTTAKATLDYENVQINYPLDEYQLSNDDEMLVIRAREQIFAECLRAHGVTPPESPTAEERGAPEDRDFGLWNVERAQRYGFEMPDNVDTANSSESSSPDSADYEQQRGACAQDPDVKAALDEVTPELWTDTSQYETSVVEQIRGAAYNAASQLPEWDAARREYGECLGQYGYTARADGWGSEEGQSLSSAASSGGDGATPSEALIRVAVAEATCNNDVQLTQRLADLVASYQAPLIRQNEAALRDEFAATQAKIQAAHSVLGE